MEPLLQCISSPGCKKGALAWIDGRERSHPGSQKAFFFSDVGMAGKGTLLIFQVGRFEWIRPASVSSLGGGWSVLC